MPLAAARDLKVGRIIDGTLGVLEKSVVPALVYLVVMTIFGLGVAWYGLDHTALQTQAVLGLGSMVIGIVAAYFLLEAILRRAGYASSLRSDAFLPYIGLAIISAIATMIGLILLILPGLILMARWSVAQPLLLTSRAGVMDALRTSWERTRGNEFPIIAAALALIALFVVVMIFAAVVYDEGDWVGMILSQLASTGMSVVLAAMGVALFELILGSDPKAAPEEMSRASALDGRR